MDSLAAFLLNQTDLSDYASFPAFVRCFPGANTALSRDSIRVIYRDIEAQAERHLNQVEANLEQFISQAGSNIAEIRQRRVKEAEPIAKENEGFHPVKQEISSTVDEEQLNQYIDLIESVLKRRSYKLKLDSMQILNNLMSFADSFESKVDYMHPYPVLKVKDGELVEVAKPSTDLAVLSEDAMYNDSDTAQAGLESLDSSRHNEHVDAGTLEGSQRASDDFSAASKHVETIQNAVFETSNILDHGKSHTSDDSLFVDEELIVDHEQMDTVENDAPDESFPNIMSEDSTSSESLLEETNQRGGTGEPVQD